MPTPYYETDGVTLHLGSCLDILPTLPDASVDAVVTDPPYGLTELAAATVLEAISAWMAGDRTHVPDGRGFMGKEWDRFVPPPGVWDECLRVLKPGGHLVAFAGARTVDLMTLSIRIAGFEVRDSLHWMYGSGFPKSLDVAKSIDKRREDAADICRVTSWLAAQAEARGISRRDVDEHMGTADMGGWWLSRLPHRAAVPTWEQWQKLRALIGCGDEMDAEVWRLNGRKGTPGEAWTERPAADYRARPGMAESWTGGQGWTGSAARGGTAVRDDATRWEGWGTALKPAHEPIVLARKPLAGTVAGTVLAHGTGALNIDGCRVAGVVPQVTQGISKAATGGNAVFGGGKDLRTEATLSQPHEAGRWPSNVILTHPPLIDEDGQPVGDACADGCVPGCPVAELDRQSGILKSGVLAPHHNAKASSNGSMSGGNYEGRIKSTFGGDSGGASRFFPVFRYEAKAPTSERPRLPDGTAHATVKPVSLMSWLVRLVTRPGGTVLEPFAGSGTTLEACVIEGMRVVGVELDEQHAELCKVRLSKPIAGTLFGDVA